MNRSGKKVIKLHPYSEIFTKKELEIAFWSQQRLSAKEIARRLGISFRTVENRLGIMYHKLGVSGSTQFIEYCQSIGLDQYIPPNLIYNGVHLLD